ncbi:lipoyl domain-containing protein [Aureibaculum sp. A20]|uniref:Lipoyl domain-containing protein n=1 Tax=Aureibaculum flavum TaxID=2795986 RepID=A0ABS0WWG4_9FLAO|nr:lipoyl domain-containing protein [Aureibaculum flavum]MBJ2176337.1 lipoyl domain-containing protein [Aureibaculum flavum]
MIKSLFQKLFSSTKKPNKTNQHVPYESKLEKGQVESVFAPELENQKNLVLTKWNIKLGDVVKPGDIICDLSNDMILMEFESMFNGKIISMCPLNTKLNKGTELFKVEGINQL